MDLKLCMELIKINLNLVILCFTKFNQTGLKDRYTHYYTLSNYNSNQDKSSEQIHKHLAKKS